MKEKEKKRILFYFTTHIYAKERKYREEFWRVPPCHLYFVNKRQINSFVIIDIYLYVLNLLVCLLCHIWLVAVFVWLCCSVILLWIVHWYYIVFVVVDCVIPVKEPRFVIVIIMSTNVRDIKIINKGNTQSQC